MRRGLELFTFTMELPQEYEQVMLRGLWANTCIILSSLLAGLFPAQRMWTTTDMQVPVIQIQYKYIIVFHRSKKAHTNISQIKQMGCDFIRTWSFNSQIWKQNVWYFFERQKLLLKLTNNMCHCSIV